MWTILNNISIIAQAPQPSTADMLTQMLVPFGLIFLVFYFLMWRPQNKQRQTHQTYLANLTSGDEIITRGGILGTIKSIDEKIVTLEISKGNKMKILKSQIKGSKAAILAGGESSTDSGDKEKSEAA